MRCRTSGSSANRTISWISFLPPSSAGCALPAMTSCIGRSGSSSSALSRSGSRSISVSRLYDGTRRAKPMVSTSGSRAESIQPSSAGAAPRSLPGLAQPLGGRRRPAARAAARLSRPDVASAGTLSTTSNSARRRRTRCRHPAAAASSKTSRATQVGRVHAVGDRADRHVGLVEGRPEAVEHAAADVAVQLGDAVGALGQPEAHHRHVEHRRVAALVVLGAEREDPLDRARRGWGCCRRSTARPGRAGSGRCRPGRGCGW